MINKKIASLVTLLIVQVLVPLQATEFPRIWVNDSDKNRILNNIEQHPWAASLKQQLEARVDPWSSRHVSDPAFLLSRFPRTWGQDNHNYTDADLRNKDTANNIPYSVSGTAPIPTFHRSDDYIPRTADGKSYVYPGIEGMEPYNEHPYFGMNLEVAGTGNVEFVHYPARFIRTLYTDIMMLGVDSAVLYYLTGKEEYAQLSADILYAFIEPMMYMNATKTSKSYVNGLFITDFLRDARILTPNFPLMYDLIHSFLSKSDTTVFDAATNSRTIFNDSNAQSVFAKLASYVLNTGITQSNWAILEGPSVLYNIAVLKDETARNSLFKTFYEEGTSRHDAFSWSLGFFTSENLWPESLGYSIDVNNRILIMMEIIDRNRELFGKDVFAVSPKMFEGAFVYENLEYPTKESIRFGDAKRARHIVEKVYANVLHIADRKGLTNYRQRATEALANFYQDKGGFNPEISDESLGYTSPLQLLWGHNFDLSEAKEPKKESALHVSHAGVMMQRNYNTSDVVEHGMMYYTGGASYVHANASGLDFEVYGAGNIMGHDYGSGFYGSDLHEKYAILHAAHNTVIVNGMAIRGQGWEGIMDDTELMAAEPASYHPPISEDFSFSCQALNDTVNNNDQQRCVGMIRTSDTSGYYLDLFRSKAKGVNHYSDYLYHNIGDSTSITDWHGNDLTLVDTPERYQNDLTKYPGWQFFSDTQTSEATDESIKVRFNLEAIDRYMNAYIVGGDGEKEVSLALAPRTPDARHGYDKKDTQLMTIRRQGAAWDNPYVVVYEPSASLATTINDVQLIKREDKVVGAQVWSQLGAQYIYDVILVNDNIKATFENSERGIRFEGQFAVIRTITENGVSDVQLYIGAGESLSLGDLSVTADADNKGFVRFNGVSDVDTSPINNQNNSGEDNNDNETSEVIYDVAKEYNWDSGSEDSYFKQVSHQIDNGIVTITLSDSDSDPYVRLTGANVDGSIYDKIRIRIRNNTSGSNWRMYFDPQGPAGEGGNSVPFTVTSGNEWQIVTIDMSADPDWQNIIEKIRIDMTPNVNGTVEIDYVQLVREVPTDNDDNITIAKEYNWDEGAEESWLKQASSTIDDGKINITLTSDLSGPYLRLDNTNVDGRIYSKIKMRVKNNTPVANWRMYFNPEGPASEAGNSVPFSVPTDNKWHVITVDMSADPDWENGIESIRINLPASVNGSVEIDFVKVFTDGIVDNDDGLTIAREFNWDEGDEDAFFKQVSHSVSDGVLSVFQSVDQTDPYVRLHGVNIDGGIFTQLKIRVKNSTTGTNWRMYFKPVGGGEGGNSVPLNVEQSTQWQVVTVDMSADSDWANMIDSIRLDLTPGVEGTVEIDYLKLFAITEELPDADSDQVPDAIDTDDDNDSVLDDVDNCPVLENPSQLDTDFDGLGDACDTDDDNDNILDVIDNCPLVANANQTDTDLDVIGDICDSDDDNDLVLDGVDNCPLDINADQANFDGDGLGDVCDLDLDGDSITNNVDMCEYTTLGDVIDSNNGCSIDQLCPCDSDISQNAWKNHGQYVACYSKTTNFFAREGFISNQIKGELMSFAANSQCGKK